MGRLRDHAVEVRSHAGSVGELLLHPRGRFGPPLVHHLSPHRRKGRDVFRQLRAGPRRVPAHRQRHRNRNGGRRLLRRRRGDPADHPHQPVRPHPPPRSHQLHRALPGAAQGGPSAPGLQQAVHPDRGGAGASRAPCLPPRRGEAATRPCSSRIASPSTRPETRAAAVRDRPAAVHRAGADAGEPDGGLRGAQRQAGVRPGPDSQSPAEPCPGSRRERAGFPRPRRGRIAARRSWA